MRKLLIIAGTALGSVILAGLIFAGIASANAGPHGNFALDTPNCAACHRAHTAAGEDLLKVSDVYALCTSCHGSDGTANTNVIDGVIRGTTNRLNGGGFVQMPFKSTGVSSVVTATAKSAHNVEGLNGGDGVGIAWGGTPSGQGIAGVLECTSCHNPHGSSNYRLLKDNDNGYGTADGFRFGDGSGGYGLWWGWQPVTAGVYTGTGVTDFNYAGKLISGTATVPASTEDAALGLPNRYSVLAYSATGKDQANYTGGIRDFCATCHRSYLTVSGSAGHLSTDGNYYAFPGTQDSGDGNGDIARYRHAMIKTYSVNSQNGMSQTLRFATASAGSSTHDQYVCTTCHFAHGSGAAYDSFAANVAPTNDSALLYYDNRGVCRSCHQKAK